MLAALGAPARPVLISDYATLLALPAGTVQDLLAMSVEVLPSPAATGRIVALDAGALAIADGGITLESARHASLVLDDGEDPPATALTSLWQRNLRGLRAERMLKFAVAGWRRMGVNR